MGLRNKMYSYVIDNGVNNKTAKGTKKIVIKQDLKHEDYKNTLFKNEQMFHKMKTIRSDHHHLSSYELNKVSLSYFGDKRYILKNGVKSYAYSHYKSQ